MKKPILFAVLGVIGLIGLVGGLTKLVLIASDKDRETPSFNIAALLSGENECDILAKRLCEDERVQMIRRINSNSEPLVLTDNLFDNRNPSAVWAGNECSRAKELARLSREERTPFYDNGIQLTGADTVNLCQISNGGLEMILMMASGKR